MIFQEMCLDEYFISHFIRFQFNSLKIKLICERLLFKPIQFQWRLFGNDFNFSLLCLTECIVIHGRMNVHFSFNVTLHRLNLSHCFTNSHNIFFIFFIFNLSMRFSACILVFCVDKLKWRVMLSSKDFQTNKTLLQIQPLFLHTNVEMSPYNYYF
jgi:hypothetical protein